MGWMGGVGEKFPVGSPERDEIVSWDGNAVLMAVLAASVFFFTPGQWAESWYIECWVSSCTALMIVCLPLMSIGTILSLRHPVRVIVVDNTVHLPFNTLYSEDVATGQCQAITRKRRRCSSNTSEASALYCMTHAKIVVQGKAWWFDDGSVEPVDPAVMRESLETTIQKIYAIPELDNFLGDRLRDGR